MSNNNEVYIFYHICTMGHYKEVIIRQFNTILNSGILNIAKQMYVCIVGKEWQEAAKLVEHDKVTILKHDDDLKKYERYTH